MEISKENITTIATLIYIVLAPMMTKYTGANIDEATFIGVIGFIIALISAKHPNNFKILENDNNNKNEPKQEEEITETNGPETLEDTEINEEGA